MERIWRKVGPLGARLCTAGWSSGREEWSEERRGDTGRPAGTCTTTQPTSAVQPKHCEQTSENGVMHVFKKIDDKIPFHSHTHRPLPLTVPILLSSNYHSGKKKALLSSPGIHHCNIKEYINCFHDGS